MHEMTEIVEKMLKLPVDYNFKVDGQTILEYICCIGHSEIALKLLELPDIILNNVDSNGNTAFFFACSNGMTECVEKMLKSISKSRI